MTVPTVERGFFEVVFCSMEIAGDSPSIESTSGFSICSRNCRAYADSDSDVAPLALGVDGVEGQRRLAGSREPGDHHELVARDLEVDVLEVVLARTSDDDSVTSHGDSLYGLASGGVTPTKDPSSP